MKRVVFRLSTLAVVCKDQRGTDTWNEIQSLPQMSRRKLTNAHTLNPPSRGLSRFDRQMHAWMHCPLCADLQLSLQRRSNVFLLYSYERAIKKQIRTSVNVRGDQLIAKSTKCGGEIGWELGKE
jgi:hypothetical protein